MSIQKLCSIEEKKKGLELQVEFWVNYSFMFILEMMFQTLLSSVNSLSFFGLLHCCYFPFLYKSQSSDGVRNMVRIIYASIKHFI